MEWNDGPAIVCYYSVLTEGGQVNQQIDIIRKRAVDGLSELGGDCGLVGSCLFRAHINR